MPPSPTSTFIETATVAAEAAATATAMKTTTTTTQQVSHESSKPNREQTVSDQDEYQTTNTSQIFDGAANVWRTVVIASVCVRWVDLGTKLVLRHVVRVLGAEEDDPDNNRTESENETRGEGNNQVEGRRKGDGGEGDRKGEDGSRGGGRDNSVAPRSRAATAEVDLNEVRWAEYTGRPKERKPSRSNAATLAGNSSWSILSEY